MFKIKLKNFYTGICNSKIRVYCVLLLGLFFASAAFGADQQIADLLSTPDHASQGPTLWSVLVSGGAVMVVIGLLSVLAVAIIVYDLTMLTVEKQAPRLFFDEIIRKLKTRNIDEARDLCIKDNNNILSKIALAGLEKAKRNPRDPIVKESMEHRARIEIGNLWQNLNYLSDIVAVSPLLGLLGTVLGMIQSFQAIPLQSAGIKTTLLAAGISKAMITTAAGLIVAIPVLMAYSYFRGKVQDITNTVEIYSTDIIRLIESI